ncbi:MAG: DUF1015 domain-containing protein [Betaproteobacteria bacterium]|nr:DUF1015 domain-containing protein [Betaproteobacteria bacterium]
MDPADCFRLPRLLLPREGIDLSRWAVVACDQYTSEPEYWERVEREVGDAPSTLHLVFPEVHLGKPDASARIGLIQRTMREYVASGVFREHIGAVYVERTIGGRARRGLMLELDLEAYDFGRDSKSPIRPTEGTMVERIAPRLEVRKAAELELPHVLVLIDDPGRTVIEPIGDAVASLARLYASDLMLRGGHVAGYAVDAEHARRATAALRELAEPAAFAARYGVPQGTPPMLFAVGDGNHSLATAKAHWDAIRASAPRDHPARYALVEVENIHDPALAFEPIHRLLFGVTADVRRALGEAIAGAKFVDVPSAAAMRDRVRQAGTARQAIGLAGPGARYCVLEIADPPSTLAVGTIQPFVDALVARGGAASVDYVHGDEALERLALQDGAVGLHLPQVSKEGLLRMVVREGPLPRKTFSMGEADEKRYYVEARRIR